MTPLKWDENWEGAETWSEAPFVLRFAAHIAPLLLAPFSQQITELKASLPCGLVFEDSSILSRLAWCQPHNKCVFVTTWVGSLLEYRTQSLPYITWLFFFSFSKCSFIKLLFLPVCLLGLKKNTFKKSPKDIKTDIKHMEVFRKISSSLHPYCVFTDSRKQIRDLKMLPVFFSVYSSLHGLHISGGLILKYGIWIVLLFLILSNFFGSDCA